MEGVRGELSNSRVYETDWTVHHHTIQRWTLCDVTRRCFHFRLVWLCVRLYRQTLCNVAPPTVPTTGSVDISDWRNMIADNIKCQCGEANEYSYVSHAVDYYRPLLDQMRLQNCLLESGVFTISFIPLPCQPA